MTDKEINNAYNAYFIQIGTNKTKANNTKTNKSKDRIIIPIVFKMIKRTPSINYPL